MFHVGENTGERDAIEGVLSEEFGQTSSTESSSSLSSVRSASSSSPIPTPAFQTNPKMIPILVRVAV